METVEKSTPRTRRMRLRTVKTRKTGDKKQTEFVIGIDLGTTYSCVGVWKDDKVEIIAGSHGSRTTPSYIAMLPNGDRIIGEPAKSRQAAFPKHVLYDIKRIIGQRFTDFGYAPALRRAAQSRLRSEDLQLCVR